MKHSNDLRKLSETYVKMRNDAVMSFSVGDVKIELLKEDESAECWIVNWYEKNIYNKDKSKNVADRSEAENYFYNMKALAIQENIKRKPHDSIIRRNTSILNNAPFVLSVEGKEYPCQSMEQAKGLAKNMQLNPQILI